MAATKQPFMNDTQTATNAKFRAGFFFRCQMSKKMPEDYLNASLKVQNVIEHVNGD